MLRGAEDGSFTRSDLPLLRHPAQVVRFLLLMREFRRHYETFKHDCLLVSQAEAIRADPLLWDLYHEPASRFIERHRIEEVNRSYLAPVVRATAFTPVDRLTAFTLLVGVLDFVVPTFEYTFRFDVLTDGFDDALLLDSVTDVESSSDHYAIRTRHGNDVVADNVVVATPIDVSARLLDLGSVKDPISAHIFLVKGDLLRPWASAMISLFPEGDPILGLARQADGSTLLSTAVADPDFARLFSTWEVLEHHDWNPHSTSWEPPSSSASRNRASTWSATTTSVTSRMPTSPAFTRRTGSSPPAGLTVHFPGTRSSVARLPDHGEAPVSCPRPPTRHGRRRRRVGPVRLRRRARARRSRRSRASAPRRRPTRA